MNSRDERVYEKWVGYIRSDAVMIHSFAFGEILVTEYGAEPPMKHSESGTFTRSVAILRTRLDMARGTESVYAMARRSSSFCLAEGEVDEGSVRHFW